MMAPPTGLLDSFVAAIQASLSVLLVISYGALAAWLNLLNSANTRAISKVCVRMFLPALLFTQIGSELHAGSAGLYGIILLWALACHLVSFALGIAGHLLLGMPDWTTVAIMFNNTTSYPLLLVQALEETGILQSLLAGEGDTVAAGISRAKAYFLVFATVSSCLTFAVGPRLIDSEHAPEPDPEPDEEDKPPQPPVAGGQDDYGDPADAGPSSNGGQPQPPEEQQQQQQPGRDRRQDEEEGANEATGLLGRRPVQFTSPFGEHNAFFPSVRRTSILRAKAQEINRRASIVPRRKWRELGPRTKWWLLFVSDFFNAPLLGAILGAVVGLTPALHRAFFSEADDGGIFSAWLTASLKNIGGLFVPLPVVVAGVSLYTAMQEVYQQSRGGSSSSSGSTRLPWLAVTYILVVRFVIWPAASIAIIYALASRTDLLGPDPMLWFAMMLMPTGPPAMKLITLIQVSDADKDDETSIAKLLTISYLISPILSLTVVGGMRASQASMGS